MLRWHEYRERNRDGSDRSQFGHHYRAFEAMLDPVMRQEHTAGEKLVVDLPGHRPAICDRRSADLAFFAELSVAVLGTSNDLYAEVVSFQQLQPFVMEHVHAFEVMGAVPEIAVCDNLRSGITRAQTPLPVRHLAPRRQGEHRYHVEAPGHRHYCSVPHSLGGRPVDLRRSAMTVDVFCASRRVASHFAQLPEQLHHPTDR